MTPQEQAEVDRIAKLDKDIARIDRQERWRTRGSIAWYWFVYGFWVYVLLTDYIPVWFLIVALTGFFIWRHLSSAAERKREAKYDQLRIDLINLDSDHDYEPTQARWDAYYFGVTGYHPNSTITISRRTP